MFEPISTESGIELFEQKSWTEFPFFFNSLIKSNSRISIPPFIGGKTSIFEPVLINVIFIFLPFFHRAL